MGLLYTYDGTHSKVRNFCCLHEMSWRSRRQGEVQSSGIRRILPLLLHLSGCMQQLITYRAYLRPTIMGNIMLDMQGQVLARGLLVRIRTTALPPSNIPAWDCRCQAGTHDPSLPVLTHQLARPMQQPSTSGRYSVPRAIIPRGGSLVAWPDVLRSPGILCTRLGDNACHRGRIKTDLRLSHHHCSSKLVSIPRHNVPCPGPSPGLCSWKCLSGIRVTCSRSCICRNTSTVPWPLHLASR
jgi:hypothetical protein